MIKDNEIVPLIDHIDFTVMNGRLVKEYKPFGKLLTKKIQSSNSWLNKKLKEYREEGLPCGFYDTQIKELLSHLSVQHHFKPVLLKNLKMWGGYGERIPQASYFFECPLGYFNILKFKEIDPFSFVLVLNPIRFAKKLYELRTGNKLSDDNHLPGYVYPHYLEILSLLNQQTLGKYFCQPLFNFFFQELKIPNRFRMWVCYDEICIDIKVNPKKMDRIIKSLQPFFEALCQKVQIQKLSKGYYLYGDMMSKKKLNLKIYPKTDKFLRIELIYLKEYIDSINIKRSIAFNQDEQSAEYGSIYSLLEDSKQYFNFFFSLSSHVSKLNPPEGKYLQILRKIRSSEETIAFFRAILKFGTETFRLKDIKAKLCNNSLKYHQISYRLHTFKLLLNPKRRGCYFLDPPIRLFIQDELDQLDKGSSQLYHYFRSIENKKFENFMQETSQRPLSPFSLEPTLDNYNVMNKMEEFYLFMEPKPPPLTSKLYDECKKLMARIR